MLRDTAGRHRSINQTVVGASVAQPQEQLRGVMGVVKRMAAECIIRKGPILLLLWKSTLIGVGSQVVYRCMCCALEYSVGIVMNHHAQKLNLAMFYVQNADADADADVDRDPTIGQTEPPLTRSCSPFAKRSICFHPTLAWRLRGH